MNLTKEQQDFVMSKQLDPEKNLQVAKTVGAICDKIGQEKLGFTSDDIQRICLISNIGQMHPDMYVNGVNIYLYDGPWDEKARTLNFNRGEYSVQMAKEQYIELSDDEKETIKGTSRGRASNLMSSMIKIAQTYIAVQRKRWNDNKEKGAIKGFNEIAGELRVTIDEISKQYTLEPQLVEDIIIATGDVYREAHQQGKVDHGDIDD